VTRDKSARQKTKVQTKASDQSNRAVARPEGKEASPRGGAVRTTHFVASSCPTRCSSVACLAFSPLLVATIDTTRFSSTGSQSQIMEKIEVECTKDVVVDLEPLSSDRTS